MPQRTYDNCLFAAQLVLKALHEIDETDCCLIGGMSIRLNGNRGREVKVSHPSTYIPSFE
jgi:hypothetical protein